MSEPTMFNVPAVGTLFDTRPMESAPTPAPEAPTFSSLCPSCGATARRNAAEQGSPVTTCHRCEQAGHLALTLEAITCE